MKIYDYIGSGALILLYGIVTVLIDKDFLEFLIYFIIIGIPIISWIDKLKKYLHLVITVSAAINGLLLYNVMQIGVLESFIVVLLSQIIYYCLYKLYARKYEIKTKSGS